MFVDYPGFNLRMAKALRKAGYQGKIVHYVCPTIWAHGAKRKQVLEKNHDLLLCIFPFEPPLFSDSQLQVRYVGHPLAEEIPEPDHKERRQDLVALFPGSRLGEIRNNLGEMLEACRSLPSHYQFAVSVANDEVAQLVHEIQAEKGFEGSLVYPDGKKQLMESAHIALACSGTVTIETALYELPTVVGYSVTFLNALIARFILNPSLRFFCIVNILANKEIFPEHYHKSFTSEEMSKSLQTLAQAPEHQECRSQCKEIRKLFGSMHGGVEAARAIKELLHDGPH